MKKRNHFRILAASVVTIAAAGAALSLYPAPAIAAPRPGRVKQLAPTSIKNSSVRIHWKTVKNASGYQVSWRKISTAGKAGSWKQKKVAGKKKSSLTVKKLSANTRYQFRVRAVGRKNKTGKWSKIRLVRTSAKIRLTAPKVTAAHARGLTGYKLNWTPVSGASSYQIAIRRSSKKWDTHTVSASATSGTFSKDLASSASYSVRIRARFGKTYGPWSATAKFTTLSRAQIRRILIRFLDGKSQGSFQRPENIDWTNPGNDYSLKVFRLVLDHYGLGNNGKWYGYHIGDGSIVKMKKQYEVYDYLVDKLESVNNYTDANADANALIAKYDTQIQNEICNVDKTISQNQDIIDQALSDSTFLKIPDFITSMNRDRANSTNAKGAVPAVKIDYNMTADAIYNLAYVTQRIKDNESFPHCAYLIMGSQCLAFGYPDPFTGWYDEEKEQYDRGDRDYNDIGHYLNVIDSYTNVVGFAKSGSTSLLNGTHDESPEYAVTPEEFRAALRSEVYPQLGY